LKAETDNFLINDNKQINIKYLETKNELEDYILDSSDLISIEFVSTPELSGVFSINEEGELFLPRIDKTYVRGLTPSELEHLLDKRFSEYLIQPEIKIRIVRFKPLRVSIRGEVRNPGIYKFPAYNSGSFIDFGDKYTSDIDLFFNEEGVNSKENKDLREDNSLGSDLIIKRSNEGITTISDVLRRSGGITSLSDLSRIKIIRDIPIGKGGGKKTTLINFYSYLYDLDPINDIRIFDGDSLFIPELSNPVNDQIPKSILSGISPKFINVNLYGRIDNPGIIRVPLEASLPDAIDLSGPIKPLSGKIILIRYSNDGTIT